MKKIAAIADESKTRVEESGSLVDCEDDDDVVDDLSNSKGL